MADAKAHGLTGSFELFKKSKEVVMNNLSTFGVLLLIPLITNLLTMFGSDADKKPLGSANYGMNLSGATLGLGAGLVIVIIVANFISSLMLNGASLEATGGKKPTLSEVWPYVPKFAARTVGLAFAVGFMVLIGFLALIVPGLIMIRRYFLAQYVMIDQDLSIGEAMKESARISKPHSGSVWGIIGVTIVLSIAGIIPVVGWIAAFVLTSLYAVAPAMRYRELKKLEGAAGHHVAPVAATE